MIRNKRGVTLVELMVTVFILSIGIVGSLLYFTTALQSAEIARDITTATTHAEFVMEEMQTLPTLSDITNTDWTSWSSTNGLNTLPSEVVTVSYTDDTSDPLEILTTVSWTKRSGTKTVTLTTQLTK